MYGADEISPYRGFRPSPKFGAQELRSPEDGTAEISQFATLTGLQPFGLQELRSYNRIALVQRGRNEVKTPPSL